MSECHHRKDFHTMALDSQCYCCTVADEGLAENMQSVGMLGRKYENIKKCWIISEGKFIPPLWMTQ